MISQIISIDFVIYHKISTHFIIEESNKIIRLKFRHKRRFQTEDI